MEVEVIDSEDGNMGQRGSISDDGEDDPHEIAEVTEPHVGMEFDSEDAAKRFYDEYARRAGFSTRVRKHNRSSGTVTTREFFCCKDGLKRRAGDSCAALLRIELRSHGKWVVMRFVKEHSHSTTSPGKVHSLRPRRHFAGAVKNNTETYTGRGTVPSGVMHVSMDRNRNMNRRAKNSTSVEPNHTIGSSAPLSSRSSRQPGHKKTLGSDAQNLLDYFKKMQAENPGFYYAIQLDEDNHMANVFWADARSRTAYSHFGDAVTLDTRYRVNQCRVPFVPFTGVNHHGQTILFACALLLDESEATFLWLFKTFLAAMNDCAPASIITDKDKVIQMSAAQVFPEARHCINKWDVLREGQERMANVCNVHPEFQGELYNCINLTQTVEEFESSWDSIIDKYDLKGNDWLQSIYNIRQQWVPVYFRDTFFAAISPNQAFESSFFDGYVDQQTTLPLFFRQYERAIESSFEKEVEADFDTTRTSPVLRTPSPMEKQTASLYTKKIFSIFQEELVETFVYTANRIDGDGTVSTFRVAKFEDDQKSYIVSLNLPEVKANCSCRMFEYSGILCRHVLTVFTVTNVLTLPSQYILNRWTRHARSGVRSEECGEVHIHESLTTRYNSLCKEAIRYAEEGAIAPETYDIVLSALKEAGKKIVAVKNKVAKVAPPSLQGVGYDDLKTSTSGPDATPSLWPRQDEMIKRFNLNDAGASALSGNMNLPLMAPISVHRGDSASDNMLILPCLKSMTWVMENKNSAPANRVAVINLKLQDYSRTPSGEFVVKFHLSRVTLEPMLKSMSYISEQLSTPANRVAVINLKLQDAEATTGESEVKFQVSKDTLGAMLRSMAYIREQLSIPVDPQQQVQSKKQRK